MTKLKVLLFTIYNYPHPGGISSHINALKDGLEKLKIEVGIFSANSLPKFFIFFIRMLYYFRNLNQTIFYPFYIITLKFFFKIFILLNFLKNKWNLINSQDPIALNCTKLIRFFYNPKIILTVHGFLTAETLVDLNTKNPLIRNLLQKEEGNAYSIANRIITIEKGRKKHILKYINKPEKIFIHKNFVNVSRFKKFPSKYLIKKFNLPENAHVILFPKRLVKASGIQYFIEAAARILEISKNYYFVILGKGYLLNKIKKSIEKQRNILYHSPVPNSLMPYILNSADIVVIPSISLGTVREGSSMAIIEAMACSIPIVATNVGGNPKIIKQEETGLLISEKNSKVLADTIIQLIQNKDLWDKISINSRKYIVENFSHIKAAKFFLDIYMLS